MTMKADTTHDLIRIIRQYSPRRHVFYTQQTGLLVTTAGRTLYASPKATVSRLLEWAATSHEDSRPSTIYIMGGAVASDVPGHDPQDELAVDRYWSAPCLDGWSITRWHRDPWRVTYERQNVVVDIAMASTWYGASHDAQSAQRAHTLLGAMLRHTFDPKATLMGTPGRTGADLFQRSLPENVSYPALPDHIRHLVADKIRQGRIEQPGFYQSETAPGVYVLDARWQYAACLRHLPVGPAVYTRHDAEYKGFRKAVYHFDTRVPDSWGHIGLVGIYSDAEGRTVYPRKPGQFIPDAWATGAEVSVLLENGWPVNIKESVLYSTQAGPGSDPARLWLERMKKLRDWAERNKDALASAACRHLVLDCVGYWHRSARPEMRWAPYGGEAAIPHDAMLVLPLPEGIRYTIPAPLDPATDALYRPEWSAQVWGAARARLVRKALEFQPKHILWLRHDSIVLDHKPFVIDEGRPGDWRVKWKHENTVAAPLTESAYREIAKWESDA